MAALIVVPVDGLSYCGIAQVLFDVLEELGVPTERVEYVYRAELGPEGLQGHIIVNLTIPTSETLQEVHAFEELHVETSIAACVQLVSRSALRRVMRDAYQHLSGGPHHLLPRALDLDRAARGQVQDVEAATNAEDDPCLWATGRYILAQDKYIMEVEMQNRHYRDLLFRADKALVQEEREKQMIIGSIAMEREGYDMMQTFYLARENALRKEIVDTRGKVGEFGLRNDYLDSKVLELEDKVICLERELSEQQEKEKRFAFRKMYLETKFDMVEKENEQWVIDTTHNYCHLVEYMKYMEYYKDKANRIQQAWVTTDAKRVREIEEVQALFPPGSHKKARMQTFRVVPTTLNTAACPSEDYESTLMTLQLEGALEYISRMRHSDEEIQELQAMGIVTSSPPSIQE